MGDSVKDDIMRANPDQFVPPDTIAWNNDVKVSSGHGDAYDNNMDRYKKANPWLEGMKGKYIEFDGELLEILEPYSSTSFKTTVWGTKQTRNNIGTKVKYPDGRVEHINNIGRFDPD